MKIVVIGGTGFIGSKVVARLRGKGHEVVPASLETGVNLLTGAGLGDAVAGARVVVDVANSPSFEPEKALGFFETAGRNLLAAEGAAGVPHHLALSIVGLERSPENGYFRAKLAQESLIKASAIPYTILRSTQFFEFFPFLVQSPPGREIRLPPVRYQPIAGEDVAATLAELAVGPPLDGTTEVAGPEARPMDEMARQYLAAIHDRHQVVTDAAAPYFGDRIDDRSLVPIGKVRLGSIRFSDWLGSLQPRK